MRSRRWLRLLLIPTALVAVVVAVGLWRLSRDDERLTRWLAESVRSASGLEMRTGATGSFGFWPRLSIALNEVSLVVPGGTAMPVRIGSIRVQVPWTSVFGRELRASRIVLGDVDLDAAAIDAWMLTRSDAGPMPAWQWPQLEAALLVENLRYRGVDSHGQAVDTFTMERLLLDSWRVDRPATLSMRFHLPALSTEPLQLQLTCTPRQTRNALAIEPCAASIGVDAQNAVAMRGYARLDGNTSSEVQLRIEAERLPEWLPIPKTKAAPQRLDLALRLIGAFSGPMKIVTGGTVGGSKIDIDAVLPYGWLPLAQSADWDRLASRATGYAKIDRFRSEGLELDDIRWRNAAAPDNSAGILPTRVIDKQVSIR